MTTSSIGLIAGLLVALCIAVGGFGGFLLALVFGVVGYLVGSHLDGDVDVRQFLGRNRRD